MKRTFEEVAKMHTDWAKTKFINGTPQGGLKHLRKEAQEVIEAIESGSKAELMFEVADCFMCLLDVAERLKIPLDEITSTMKIKLEINKGREWVDNGDGSYSHVKPPQSGGTLISSSDIK